MNGLRWILLAAGLAFIAFVYLFTRFQQGRRGATTRQARDAEADVDLFDHLERAPERGLGSEFDDDEVRRELERMARFVDDRDTLDATGVATPITAAEQPVFEAGRAEPAAAPAVVDEEQLIVLSVMAPAGHPFRGSALRTAFERAGLEFGEMNIFHRTALAGGRRVPVFSVASAVKPGTFDLGAMENFTTPGLSLFLQLPGPVAGVEAFDDLVNTAERLAAELGGVLRDHDHHAVTHQMLMHVRQQLASASAGLQRSAP